VALELHALNIETALQNPWSVIKTGECGNEILNCCQREPERKKSRNQFPDHF
jgi:hypothetical protein